MSHYLVNTMPLGNEDYVFLEKMPAGAEEYDYRMAIGEPMGADYPADPRMYMSDEHPGAPARHYPVPTVDGRYERVNVELQEEVTARLGGVPTFFCGRLSTYTYIDQDQAIERAFDCADAVGRALTSR